MPIVPTYQDRQVRTAPLQPVMQQTLDVSSGARAVAQGLGQVAEAADRNDLRDAQAKASTAESAITSEWLKWDSANRSKYRGANADGYAPAAEAWWKSAAENAGKDLDPRAKTLASQNLRAKQTAAMGNVLTFTGAEKERHADETYAADVNTTIQFGVTSGDVASTAVQIRDKAAVLGARKGWTTEQVQAEAGKNLSSMHLAQITKLAESNAEAAQAYYDANKAEVAFQNQARVEQVLKGELDNQFATQTAASMADKPLKEQLAEAAKITDPQRREKTLMQVRNNHALGKQAEAEQEAQFSDQAWQLFSRNQKIPEVVLSGMNGRERAQLQESMRTRSERLAAGTPDKKKNPEIAVNLTNEIDRRVRSASAAKGGKDLSADEKQGIVDRVVLDKVYVDEWGTDPQKPLALLTPDELKKAYVRVDGRNVPVSAVPMTDRRQIVKALQATGQAATEQAIVEMYLAGQKKGPAK